MLRVNKGLLYHLICMVCLIGLMFSISGCKNKAGVGFSHDNNHFYFTTKPLRNVVFSTEDVTLTKGQVEVVLYAIRKDYEKVLSVNIWDVTIEDKGIMEYLEEDVLDMLTRLVLVNQMAKDSNISLSDAEKDSVAEFKASFCEENPEVLELAGEGEIEALLRMLRLSDKVYDEYTKNADTSVSIDEARVIKIEYIYTRESIRNIEKAKQELDEGTPFESAVLEFSEATEHTANLGRNEVAKEFERAAFDLAAGEISDVISCDNGYYIIKCIDDNVEGMYDIRTSEIISERKNAIFEEAFEEYIQDAYIDFDRSAWENKK